VTRRKPEPDTFRSIGDVAGPIIDRVAQKMREGRPRDDEPTPEVPGAEVEEKAS